MTAARANTAHTVPEIDAVHTMAASRGAVMDGENDRVTLMERHDFWPRLHARALFSQHELATSEITFGFGQQYRDLEWEDVLTV